MADLLSFVSAAFFLVFGVHRLVITRRPWSDSAQRYVYGFALCLGSGMLFNTPALTKALSSDTTFDNLVNLGIHDVKMVGFAFLVLVAYALKSPAAAAPRAVRLQMWAAGAVLAVSTALYLVADPAIAGDTLTVSSGHRWALASYNALFALYGSWCLAVLARELADHAARTAPGLLRTGLRLMLLAAAVGAVWTLWALDDVIADLRTGSQGVAEDVVSSVLGAVTAALATGGATTTLWVGALGAPMRWLRAYRSHRALEPLWSALHSELPEIALDPSAADRRPGLRQAEFALYRRVIEIRDGHLALRPYFESGVTAWTDGRGGDDGSEVTGGDAIDWADERGRDRRAVLEAATIAAALENKRAGRLCEGTAAERFAPPGHTPPTVPGTVEAEAAWLLEVTAAFTSSPTVAAVRHRTRTTAAAHTAGVRASEARMPEARNG
ncbi:MAB_1171c family putative transporter [Streptomyces sp. NPDC003300]|uniref:MAB_1171c family putative transporter n=1 Tax=unclassified Streptomyces TaxID=2593676 RepID=UPI0033ABF300